MIITIVVLSAVTLVSLVVAGFFWLEFIKKTRLMRWYFNKSHGNYLTWHHGGVPTPGMYNIVFRAQACRPFVVMQAFTLHLPFIGELTDPYGGVESNQKGVAVISTWLGHGAVTFESLISGEGVYAYNVTVSCSAADQELTPMRVYKAHWFQPPWDTITYRLAKMFRLAR